MERFAQAEKEDTRLTQQELELVLNRWREEKENTVSVADVAEALHCSKAEIEALVWRARAEGAAVTQRAKLRPGALPLRSVMIAFLGFAVLLCFIAGASHEPGFRDYTFGLAGFILVGWTVYATLSVLIDAINKRR